MKCLFLLSKKFHFQDNKTGIDKGISLVRFREGAQGELCPSKGTVEFPSETLKAFFMEEMTC